MEYGPLGIEVPSLVFNRDDVSISKPNGFKNDSSILDQTIITKKKDDSPIKIVIFLKKKKVLITKIKKKPKPIPINLLTTVKNVSIAIKKLKNNTVFKSPKNLTDQQIEILNDYAFCKENTVQSKDDFKLLLAQSMASRIYYKFKIYVTHSWLFQKGSKIYILF